MKNVVAEEFNEARTIRFGRTANLEPPGHYAMVRLDHAADHGSPLTLNWQRGAHG